MANMNLIFFKKKKCATCGKEYDKRRSKYCSNACSTKKNIVKRNLIFLKKKKCATCGKEYDKRRSKYCSNACSAKRYALNCNKCGIKFIGYYKKKFCQDCSLKNLKENYFCKKCSTIKKYEDFRHVDKRGKGKKNGWKDIEGKKRYNVCKVCESLRSQKMYRDDGSRIRFNTIKKRALEKNIPFELTLEDFKELFSNMPDRCPVLDIKLEYRKIGGSLRYQSPNSPSIDRIDPQKGYVKSNIMVMSALANRIKTDATIDQIKKVYEFLKKKY